MYSVIRVDVRRYKHTPDFVSLHPGYKQEASAANAFQIQYSRSRGPAPGYSSSLVTRPSPLFHNYRSPDEAPRNPGNLQGIAIAAVQV